MKIIKFNSGRTLIELMVSIAIALIITAFLVGIYLSSVQTSRLASERSNINDSVGVLFAMIGNAIRQAGYGEIIGGSEMIAATPSELLRVNTLFPDDAGRNDLRIVGCSNRGFSNANTTAPSCGGGNTPNFDSLMVRFQGDSVVAAPQGELDDCLGQTAPDINEANYGFSRPMIQNVYTRSAVAGATDQLVCLGNGGSAAHLLLPNVEQFKVFYGFDDTLGATSEQPIARSIRTAEEIEALVVPGLPRHRIWDSVVSVHICIRVRSSDSDGLGVVSGTANTFTPCPTTPAEVSGETPITQVAASDRYLRKTFRQTYNVRSASSVRSNITAP